MWGGGRAYTLVAMSISKACLASLVVPKKAASQPGTQQGKLLEPQKPTVWNTEREDEIDSRICCL